MLLFEVVWKRIFRPVPGENVVVAEGGLVYAKDDGEGLFRVLGRDGHLLAKGEGLVEGADLRFVVIAPIARALVGARRGGFDIIGRLPVQLYRNAAFDDQGGALVAGKFDVDGAVVGAIIAGVEGIDDAVCKADGGIGHIFHLDASENTAINKAFYAFHFAAEQKAHQIDAVYGLVDDHAAAFLFPGAFPIAGIVGGRAAPVERGPHTLDFAQSAIFYQLFQRDNARHIAALKNNTELLSRFFGGLYHAVGIGKRGGNGLFREHMEACVQAAQGMLAVQIMRREDMHRVKGLQEQILDIVRIAAALKMRGEVFCPVQNLVDGKAGLQDILHGGKGRQICRSDAPAADDADFIFFLHRMLLCCFMLRIVAYTLFYCHKTQRFFCFAALRFLQGDVFTKNAFKKAP